MRGSVSSALEAALVAAATVDLCPACAEPANSGLCHSDRCRRAVLPRGMLSPLRDAHSGPFHPMNAPLTESESAAVRKARRRNERKRQRAAARLRVALAGGFARVSRTAA